MATLRTAIWFFFGLISIIFYENCCRYLRAVLFGTSALICINILFYFWKVSINMVTLRNFDVIFYACTGPLKCRNPQRSWNFMASESTATEFHCWSSGRVYCRWSSCKTSNSDTWRQGIDWSNSFTNLASSTPNPMWTKFHSRPLSNL
jgi:hypothetical protein